MIRQLSVLVRGGLVHAKKVGETKVKCKITKKSTGKLYKTCTATVTVKANAKKVTILNAPDKNAMKLGSEFDFNREMVAENGGKATDKTEWLSSDLSILAIKSNGVANAVGIGTVEIKCRTYQSKSTKATTTAISEPVTISVTNYISETAIKSRDTMEITLGASDADISESDFEIKAVAEDKVLPVKSIEVDETGKKVLVHLEASLLPLTEYQITYKNCEPVSMQTQGFAVSALSIEPHTAMVNTPADVTVTTKDASGMVLDTYKLGDPNLPKELVFTVKPTEGSINADGQLTFTSVAGTADAEAVYTQEDGTEIRENITITAVKREVELDFEPKVIREAKRQRRFISLSRTNHLVRS